MPLHLNDIVLWLSMDVIVTCSTYTRYWSLLGSPNMHKYHAAFHRYDVHPANDPGAAARSPSTRDAMGSPHGYHNLGQESKKMQLQSMAWRRKLRERERTNIDALTLQHESHRSRNRESPTSVVFTTEQLPSFTQSFTPTIHTSNGSR